MKHAVVQIIIFIKTIVYPESRTRSSMFARGGGGYIATGTVGRILRCKSQARLRIRLVPVFVGCFPWEVLNWPCVPGIPSADVKQRNHSPSCVRVRACERCEMPMSYPFSGIPQGIEHRVFCFYFQFPH